MTELNSDNDDIMMPPADQDVCMVLLVDDQAMVGETVRRMLADAADLDFHQCTNAVDALASAERIRPTVILQDLIMPGLDGMTLVTRYRASPVTRDTPIIVLSTKEDARVKENAFAAGANDYLVKLPDKIELIARIRLHANAFLNRRQRDEAHRALRESQRQLLASNAALRTLNDELQESLAKVKQLSGLLPICSYCKKIRSDQNYWQQVDHYISDHSEVKFSHGICPSCFERVASELDE